MKSKSLPVDSIRDDGGTQSRAGMDDATLAEYAAAYAAGADMPPVVVFYDGTTHWLADGFHRVMARRMAGGGRIAADIRQGTQRDAILFSCGANAQHGLKRTNADKRRAVETLLRDAEWGACSDRWIAEACAVDHKTVAALRSNGAFPVSTPRVTKDGRERKVPATTPASLVSANGAQNGASTGGDDDGEEGAGVMAGVVDHVAGSIPAAPAPDEPPVDMLGLSASAEWLETTRIASDIVGSIDNELRRLQGVARALPQPHGSRLHAALHDAAAVARAVRPEVACPLCKDPDGMKGKRKGCLGCAGNGWLSVEGRKGLHPSMLAPGGVAIAKDPRQPGRYEVAISPAPARPRGIRVMLDTPAGEVPFDDVPDPTDEDAA